MWATSWLLIDQIGSRSHHEGTFMLPFVKCSYTMHFDDNLVLESFKKGIFVKQVKFM